jgi:Calx-beta domain-containing protein/uncharacterized protein DUF4214
MRFGGLSFFLLALVLAAGALLQSRPTRAQAASTIYFSAPFYLVREGDGQAFIGVTRGGDTSGPVSVDYATSEGTASRRADFTPAFGTLRFAAGETSKPFSVLITDDFVPEGSETVDLMLFNPTGGATLAQPDYAVLNIADNDSTPSNANPIDDARAFVRQQYHDFLNREPDQAGLDFWAGQIESCGADQECREVKRINVSAAFFLSIEFQETGYFVRRLYLFYFAEISPIWREFMRDTQELSRGVIVGQPGWEEQLAANKRVFIEDWYARHRVVLESQLAANPSSFTNEQYVFALFQKVQITPTDAERQALIDGLNAGTETRASVLGKVADNPELVRREFNGAFVLMQYLGYLRREPDLGGYHFWLDKLNQFNGNFADAEMVKAFISSSEYRNRFIQSDALPEAFFESDVQPNADRVVFKLNDAARISQARALAGQNKWIVGIVLKEPIYYNRPWHFHLDPPSIGFADITAEACQTNFPAVESNLDAVGGSYAFGNIVCVAGQSLREVSPPPR